MTLHESITFSLWILAMFLAEMVGVLELVHWAGWI